MRKLIAWLQDQLAANRGYGMPYDAPGPVSHPPDAKGRAIRDRIFEQRRKAGR